jgi:hypothetical protein
MGEAWSICWNHKLQLNPRNPVKHENPNAIINMTLPNCGTFHIASGINGWGTLDSRTRNAAIKANPSSNEKIMYHVLHPFGAFSASLERLGKS